MRNLLFDALRRQLRVKFSTSRGGRRCDYDPRAFTSRGIDHVPLPAACHRTGPAGATLAAADGILARLDGCGGAVAVHGGPGGAGVDRGLLAACLVRRRLFDARAAVAWLHLAWPPCPAAAAAAAAAAAGSADQAPIAGGAQA